MNFDIVFLCKIQSKSDNINSQIAGGRGHHAKSERKMRICGIHDFLS